jgi:hypothetical protein
VLDILAFQMQQMEVATAVSASKDVDQAINLFAFVFQVNRTQTTVDGSRLRKLRSASATWVMTPLIMYENVLLMNVCAMNPAYS